MVSIKFFEKNNKTIKENSQNEINISLELGRIRGDKTTLKTEYAEKLIFLKFLLNKKNFVNDSEILDLLLSIFKNSKENLNLNKNSINILEKYQKENKNLNFDYLSKKYL